MTRARLAALLLVLLDALAVVVVFNVIASLYGLEAWTDSFAIALLLPVLMLGLAVYLIDGYNLRTDLLSAAYATHHAVAILAVMGLTLLLTYAVIPPPFTLQTSRFVTTVSFILLVPITLVYRRAIKQRMEARRHHQYFIFLGTAEQCAEFDAECRRKKMTQSVVCVRHGPSAEPARPGSAAPAVSPAELFGALKAYEGRIEAIILRESAHELPAELAQKLVDLHFSGVPTYTLELFNELYWRKIPLYRLNQTWLFQEGFQIAREPVFERLKRASDILLSTTGLLFGLLVLPFIAAAIKLDDRGEVFFAQPRVGRNRAVFRLLKFRTMRASAAGDTYTRAEDSRITRVGRFLRSTRLDELPQLWNVLRGDMSLIGPRAEWTKLVAEYERQIPCYHFRHLVKPGVTGWAQINYPYGENLDDTLRKLEYDLYYIRYFSFALDASIVLKTIHVMLFGKGR